MISSLHHASSPAGDFHPAPVPSTRSLTRLGEAAAGCTACPLYRNATQTVFGEGPRSARLVLVGEQPGDAEDRSGRPFVGPAGTLLDRAMEEAGIDRSVAYVTNAVKHFKWEPQGKRRLHKKPSAREIAACRPWLEAELNVIKPVVLICLGATAAQSILGPSVRVLRDRGRTMESPFCERTLVTVHPSSLLRAPSDEARRTNYALFVKDLQIAQTFLRESH